MVKESAKVGLQNLVRMPCYQVAISKWLGFGNLFPAGRARENAGDEEKPSC